MSNEIKISKISNGMTIAFDKMDEVDSVIVQVAVPVGSQNELREEGGISHFLEHMAFKGTTTRTAKQIAEAIESVGGYSNAYTSRETTAFHARVLKDDKNVAIDILSDIMQNPTFQKEELERER